MAVTLQARGYGFESRWLHPSQMHFRHLPHSPIWKPAAANCSSWLPAVPPGLGVGSARQRARPMLGLTRRSAAEQLLHRSQFFGEDITPLVGAATVNQAPEIG
jgi:hypothetical protein